MTPNLGRTKKGRPRVEESRTGQQIGDLRVIDGESRAVQAIALSSWLDFLDERGPWLAIDIPDDVDAAAEAQVHGQALGGRVEFAHAVLRAMRDRRNGPFVSQAESLENLRFEKSLDSAKRHLRHLESRNREFYSARFN